MSDHSEVEAVPASQDTKPAGGRRFEPFRFIHAGDFRLNEPLTGLSELPTDMKNTLASAPYIAAERLFDTAISERVAFMVLSGNLVDLDFGGPRAIAFLLSQFERLAQRDIQVFWCGGQLDLMDRWPTSIPMPDNVHTFPSTLVDTQVVKNGQGKTLATILGGAYDPHRTSLRDFQATHAEGFPIGLTCGEFEPARLAGQAIRYWALGGRDKRHMSGQGPVAYSYPGVPQAKSASCPGPHGGILVSVENSGQIRTQAIDIEVARWMELSINVSESVKLDALKDLLADRALQVISKLPDANLLVHWKIATTGDYSPQFRQQENRKTLIHWLRHEFGGSPGMWTVDVTMTSSQSIPKIWYEEDTILGDFLREVSRFRNDAELPLNLQTYDPIQEDIENVGRLSKLRKGHRDLLLDEVVLEGIERLGGNEA